MNQLCHPLLKGAIISLTPLCQDVIEIIGTYWVELHFHRKMSKNTLVFKKQDILQFFQHEPVFQTNHPHIFLEKCLWWQGKASRSGHRIEYILGQTKLDNHIIHVFRHIVNQPSKAIWMISSDLNVLLLKIDSFALQSFLHYQHSCQKYILDGSHSEEGVDKEQEDDNDW